jgi:hypothetical protein
MMLSEEIDGSLLVEWADIHILTSLSSIWLTSAEWRGSRNPKRRHVTPNKITNVPTLNDQAKHLRWTCQHSTSLLLCPAPAARMAK